MANIPPETHNFFVTFILIYLINCNHNHRSSVRNTFVYLVHFSHCIQKTSMTNLFIQFNDRDRLPCMCVCLCVCTFINNHNYNKKIIINEKEKVHKQPASARLSPVIGNLCKFFIDSQISCWFLCGLTLIFNIFVPT